MNTPNDTRLIYDECTYKEKLKRTVGPGLYNLNVPYNDCADCSKDIPADPSLRYQKWGPNTCTMKESIDDSSELLGLNYKLSKCNADEYLPGTGRLKLAELKSEFEIAKIRPIENKRKK